MSEQHARAALARGQARSAKTEAQVQQAMSDIVREIKENNGIYPHNGGAVSKNEVARRAGINATTLFSNKQKALGERVKLWLDTLKKKEVIGRMRVRRTFAERADDWKAMYEALKNSNLVTELDLQNALAEQQNTLTERDEARAEAAKLHQENATLRRQLSLVGKSRVTPIMKKDD
jgi:hypothetical protein